MPSGKYFKNAVQTDSVSDAEYMEKWNNNSAANIKRGRTMKQLVCEACGSSDLIKQDGVFVCRPAVINPDS